MYDLSIIIPSYNTKDTTQKCINSLLNNLRKSPLKFQIIVVDNHSTDGSITMLKTFEYPNFVLVTNTKNEGYAKANNIGLRYVQGQTILYLNSDVIINKTISFLKILTFLDNHTNVAGLTVKVILPTGKMDMACHRGFPTLWRSFCYFIKLEHIFKYTPILNRIFCGYHLWNKLTNSVHEIDSPSGAFFLVKKKVIDIVGGFDEDYFMYGEDLDLSYRIKKLGLKIVYYPLYSVLHLKGHSGIAQGKDNQSIKIKSKASFFATMGTFYNKHYYHLYPRLLSKFILFLITQITKQYEKNRN